MVLCFSVVMFHNCLQPLELIKERKGQDANYNIKANVNLKSKVSPNKTIWKIKGSKGVIKDRGKSMENHVDTMKILSES